MFSEGSQAAKMIIGGAPLDQSFVDEVGTDGYAPGATNAINLDKCLLKS